MLRHIIVWTAAASIVLAAGQAGCNRNRAGRAAGRTMPSPEPRAGSQPAPAPDIAFLQAAAMSGNGEIELSDIAVHQAASEQVRRLARQMFDDHTALNNDLVQLARAKNITLPTMPSTRHRAAAERLQNLSGADLDREYLRLMVDDHQTSVAIFDNKASTAQDPQVRDLAARSLPVLRHHLEMVRRLTADLGTPGGSANDTDPTTRPIQGTPPATPPAPSEPVRPADPGDTPPSTPPHPETPGSTPPATPPSTPR